MTGRTQIRPAEPQDLPRLRALESHCFDPPWSEAALAEELTRERALALVVEENSETVGYALFRYVFDEAELLRLAIAPETRRRGLARQLLDAAWPLLARQGIEHCWLEVRSDNHGAIAFYDDRGFGEAGRRKAYYRDGVDALLLQRALPVPDEHCPTNQAGAKLEGTK